MKPPRRGALSARALGFAQGDDYSAAQALRDEPGEVSPHARRLAERDERQQREEPLAPRELLAGLGEED